MSNNEIFWRDRIPASIYSMLLAYRTLMLNKGATSSLKEKRLLSVDKANDELMAKIKLPIYAQMPVRYSKDGSRIIHTKIRPHQNGPFIKFGDD